jgi:hypothetical protein
MNLTIGNARVISWKNIKTQYVAAACGLALAAAAVTGLSVRQDSAPAAPISQPQRVSVSAPGTLPMPQLVFFIAGSELQATDHIARLRMDLNPEAGISYLYQVVSNTKDEAETRTLTDSIASELAVAGTNFQVIDLR